MVAETRHFTSIVLCLTVNNVPPTPLNGRRQKECSFPLRTPVLAFVTTRWFQGDGGRWNVVETSDECRGGVKVWVVVSLMKGKLGLPAGALLGQFNGKL